MTDSAAPPDPCLEFEFELDERPEKVWKAISIPAYREQWLPDQKVMEVLDEQHLLHLELLVEEAEAPYGRGVVTFSLRPGEGGGTVFGIVHRRHVASMAANDDAPRMLLAA